MRRLSFAIILLLLISLLLSVNLVAAEAVVGQAEKNGVRVTGYQKVVSQIRRGGNVVRAGVRRATSAKVIARARARTMACGVIYAYADAQVRPKLPCSMLWGLRARPAGAGGGGLAPLITVQTFTIADVQQLPLPAGTMVVEPPGGYVLAEVPANVYASSTGQSEIGTSVLGIPVMVRVTPVAWSWDFGDGGRVGPTSDPGGPYPRLVNTHTYRRIGSYPITMTTHYSAELSVSGGPYEPIPGRATVASDPVTVQVLAGRTELRAS